jgi:hypothetical protein
MRLGTEPAVPHLTIDNRLTATALTDQVTTLLATILSRPDQRRR